MANDSNGLTPARPPEAGPDPNSVPEVPTATVQSGGVQSARVDPRRVLWRDSATILVFVVLALLGAEAFLPRGGPSPTDTPIPSEVTVGSLPPRFSLPPGVTFGPIIDPSLGIDATPTPIPVITEGPTPTPGPSPSPSLSPSLKPSSKPSTAPSAGPTDAPAAPIAGFTWDPNPAPVGQPVAFTDTSTNATSWSWDFGDGATSSEQNPMHTYTEALPCSPVPLSCSVTLVVTGPGGTDFVTHPVDVSVPSAT